MKKKTIIFITVAIVSVILTTVAVVVIIKSMYKAQYNSNGVSHFLVVTVDKEQNMEYIADLEGHKVYIEGFDLLKTNYRTFDAKDLSIKDAISKKLISIEEMEKYATKIEKSGSTKILKYENYEIYIDTDNIIIRPLQ